MSKEAKQIRFTQVREESKKIKNKISNIMSYNKFNFIYYIFITWLFISAVIYSYRYI